MQSKVHTMPFFGVLELAQGIYGECNNDHSLVRSAGDGTGSLVRKRDAGGLAA